MRHIGKAMLATAVLSAFAPLARAQNADAGRKVAQAICAECHLIDQSGMRDGLKAPGFLDIATMRSTTELSLKVFLQSPHASMPSIHLTQPELDDVVTYILSLNNRT